MKLQKHRTRKDKDYYKYVVVVPKEIVKRVGFKEGDELEAGVKEGKIELGKEEV